MAPFVASKNNKFRNQTHYLMETSEEGNEKMQLKAIKSTCRIEFEFITGTNEKQNKRNINYTHLLLQ